MGELVGNGKFEGELRHMDLVFDVLTFMAADILEQYHRSRKARGEEPCNAEKNFVQNKVKYNLYAPEFTKSNRPPKKLTDITKNVEWPDVLFMLEEYLKNPSWAVVFDEMSRLKDKPSRKLYAVLKALAGRSYDDDEETEDEVTDDDEVIVVDDPVEDAAVEDAETEPKIEPEPVEEVSPRGRMFDLQPDVEFNKKLTRKLKPYQRAGVKAILNGFRLHRGALLADEMGGGKTLQALAVINQLQMDAKKMGNAPLRVLVVCQTSVMQTWVDESDAFGTHPMYKYEGDLAWLIGTQQFVIVPYSIVQNKKSIDRLSKIKFDVVIIDEAHICKNAKSLVCKGVKRLRSKYRLLITGTPVPNKLLDLHTLVDITKKKYLGTAEDFESRYQSVICNGRKKGATLKSKNAASRAVEELRERMEPIIIRRIGLTSLPVDKFDTILLVEPTDEQKSAMKQVVNINSAQGREHVLVRCTDMQLIGVHPNYLAYVNQKAAALMRRKDASDVQEPPTPKVAIDEIPLSSKLGACCALILDALLNDDKIVVCSKFRSTLDILQMVCEQLYLVEFGRLDGDVKEGARVESIGAFNNPDSNIKVFLLSSKAGGCGIQLTGANRLVMAEVDWTPANDHQAMARIYRPGQKKTCHIIRLVEAGGFEELLLRRQDDKNAVASSVIDNISQKTLFKRTDVLTKLEHRYSELPVVSETHKFMHCNRCVDGVELHKPSRALTNSLANYHHVTKLTKHLMEDAVVRRIWTNHSRFVFAFAKKLNGSGSTEIILD